MEPLYNLGKLAKEGKLIECADNDDVRYQVRNEYTGELVPAERFLFAPCGNDFHAYVQKFCKATLYYHPHEKRQVEHQDLWPGRPLQALVFEGATVWVNAVATNWVSSVNGEHVYEDSDEHEPSSALVDYWVDLSFEQRDLRKGSLVKFQGLKAQQHLNGQLALVIGGKTKGGKDGRYPVQCWDETKLENPLRELAVKPENLAICTSMRFAVHCITIQKGGVLIPFDDSKGLPKQTRLSFKWMERLSGQPPWFFVPDSPEAAWRQPYDTQTNESVELLGKVFEQQLDKCLQHDDENEVVRGINKIKDSLIQSVVTMTALGSKGGLRESRRRLLAQPLAIIALVEKELVYRFDHCHILQVMAAVYEEFETKTDRFSKEFFDPRYAAVYARAGIMDATELHQWSQTWYMDVLEQYVRMGEYRAAIKWGKALEDRWKALALMSPGQFVHDTNFLSLLGRSYCSVGMFVEAGCKEIDQWRSTGGNKFALELGHHFPDRVYTPPRTMDSDDEVDDVHECVVCGKMDAPHTCNGCDGPRFCGRECQITHWRQGHRDVCPGIKTLGNCKICDKGSNLVCAFCLAAFYCSEECQKNDWEDGHRESCPRDQ